MKSISQLKIYSKQNKRRDVKYERIFRKTMLRAGIKYRKQVVIGYYIVDFLLRDRRLIIEIDEDHHKAQKIADIKRENYLKSLGFHVLRIEYDSNFNHAINIINRYKSDRSHINFCKNKINKLNDNRKHELVNIQFNRDYLRIINENRALTEEFRQIINN